MSNPKMYASWFGAAMLAMVLTVACTDDPPTSPSPTVPTQATPGPVAVTPVQVAPVVEETPKPGSAPGPLTFDGTNCKGALKNASANAKWADVKYTAPLDNSIEHLKVRFLVPGNGSLNVPSAQSVFEDNFEIPEPSCDPWSWAQPVQCDGVGGVGSGGAYHIFGQGADVSLSVAAIKDEPVGEPEVTRKLVCEEEIKQDGEKCWQDCVLTITRTQRYTCSEPKVEVKSQPKRKPVDCPCIEQWGEWIEGEETCGEWGECLEQPHVASADVTQSCNTKCHQRQECTVALTRTEKCTGRTETKDGEPHIHSRDCPCPSFCPAELPSEGFYPQQGNPAAECGFFGPYSSTGKENRWPWDQNNGDFYLCKAGTQMYLSHSKFPKYGTKCPNGKGISHITSCKCIER